MGDMNFRPNATQFATLQSTGWQNLALEPVWRIDQVWLDPTSKATTGSWWASFDSPADISDHRPVGVDVTLVAESRDYAAAPKGVTVGKMSYACPMP